MIEGLNKHFESRVRLGVMSLLVLGQVIDFRQLKETLKVTDGNLATHMKTLEKNGYVTYKKEFVGKKPRTSYSATAAGKKAFADHIDALETILKNSKG